MKTKKIKVRQGFTIVELVIVIGVIGVLTAVLVPTFINLNKRAEAASQQSFLKNVNTQLAMRQAEGKKFDTMYDAIQVADEMGFDVEKISPIDGNDIVYDNVAKRFAMIKGEEVTYSDGGLKGSGIEIWKIADSAEKAAALNTAGYSIYAKSSWNIGNLAAIKVGFDAGKNMTATSVSYTDSSTQAAIIRTNGGTLTVNAPAGTINHYGLASVVDVQAVAPTSYYENGIVSIAKLKTGRVVVTAKAILSTLHAVETGGNFNNVKIALVSGAQTPAFTRDDVAMNNGDKKVVLEIQSLASESAVDEHPQFVWISKAGEAVSTDVANSGSSLTEETKIPESSQTPAAKEAAVEAVTGTTAEQLEEAVSKAGRYAGGFGTEQKPYLISTKDHVDSFEEDIHAGESAHHYKLLSDLTLPEAYMFGSVHYSYYGNGSNTLEANAIFMDGTFDGGGHTINYKMSNLASSGENGGVGLFAMTKNVTIKNLNVVADLDATASTVQSPFTGGLVGYAEGYLTFDNVNISGSIKAKRDVGGFLGVHGEDDPEKPLTFNNCTSNVAITMSSVRTGFAPIGGYVGQAYTARGYFNNCVSNSQLTIKKENDTQYPCASYFIGFASDNKMGDNNYGSFAFNNCTVRSGASVSSECGYTVTKNAKTFYCTPTSENIGHCAGSAFLGTSSGMDSGATPKVSMTINGAAFDMTKYLVA